MTGVTVFADCRCALGEGPLWHPGLQRFFWFDIPNHLLLSADADGRAVDRFEFAEPVSAAAIIDNTTLAIASGAGLLRLDLHTGQRELFATLETDRPGNRSNDGRVGPSGSWWIGTMSRTDPVTTRTGSLYWVRGSRVVRLLSDINIPNAICFSPDGRTAYFADGVTRRIKSVSIDAAGFPRGPWQDFARVQQPAEPDGAVVDSQGCIWNAEWDGGRVVRYLPDGRIDRVIELPVSRPTCPAFGGSDLKTLFITSARAGLSSEQLQREPLAGNVFAIKLDTPGLPETNFQGQGDN